MKFRKSYLSLSCRLRFAFSFWSRRWESARSTVIRSASRLNGFSM